MNKILCGSTYFFQNCPDFKPKDKDEIVIVDKGIGYNFVKQVSTGHNCTFYVVRRPKEELIQYTLEKAPAMAIGKFFIPEFANEFDITLEDLAKFEGMIEKLDTKHAYLKDVYSAYRENNEFSLTDEQRSKAYETYKEARKENKSEITKSNNE